MNKNLLERYNVAVKSLVVYLRDENKETEAELKKAIVELVKGMKEKKWTKLSCSKKQDVWKIRRKVYKITGLKMCDLLLSLIQISNKKLILLGAMFCRYSQNWFALQYKARDFLFILSSSNILWI